MIENELGQVRQILLSDKTIESAIDTSIKKNPEKLASIISPIIGPSIRKSVIDYFEKMMLAFNRAIENSFSLQGILWRWEAARSGKKFSDVVLLHSLVFRVEDVLLIHKKSGILLLHKSIEERDTSVDKVASILTAIHDFAKDTFSTEKKTQALRSIRVGEINLIIEEDDELILASAIRGEAPYKYRFKLQQKLNEFHNIFQNQLIHFNGDVSLFASASSMLDDCMEIKLKDSPDETKKKDIKKKIVFGILILIIGYLIITAALRIANHLVLKDSVESYISRLENTPSVVVLESEKLSFDKWRVRILKDALSKEDIPIPPKEISEQVKVVSKSYISTPLEVQQALDEIKILYSSDRFELNGDPDEQIDLFARLVVPIYSSALERKVNFSIFAYAYGEPENSKLKILLSNLIGRMEAALEVHGIKNPKIIRYSILKTPDHLKSPLVRFEVIYD